MCLQFKHEISLYSKTRFLERGQKEDNLYSVCIIRVSVLSCLPEKNVIDTCFIDIKTKQTFEQESVA